MRLRSIAFIVLSVVSLGLFGCGGGDGVAAAPSSGGGQSPTGTVVSGVASKGPIAGGTVSAFKIVNGVKNVMLATGTTKSDGSYSLDLGSYTGPVLIEMVGGSYTDEATGAIVLLSTPLRAAIPSFTGTISAAITPLTELAVRMAEKTALTANTISAANSLVGSLFKIGDIVGTQPAAPSPVAMALATQSQKDYTLALATLSKMMFSLGVDLPTLLADMNNRIVNSMLPSDLATCFHNSLPSAITGLGLPSSTATSLSNVGGRTAVITLATTGVLPTGTLICGITTVLQMPQYVSVYADVDGQIDQSSLVSSGNAVGSAILGKYDKATQRLNVSVPNQDGFGAGEFATVYVFVPDTVVVTQDSFTKVSFMGKDASGNSLSSLLLSISVK